MANSRTLNTDIEFIYDHQTQWHKFEDQAFYISFSKPVYEKHKKSGIDSESFHLMPTDTKVLPTHFAKQVKSIIEREWIAKTNLPIRFLSSSDAVSSLAKKKIIYIFAASNPDEDVTSTTAHFKKPHENKFKLITLALPDNKQLSTYDIYSLLHELGHAFGLKHPLSFSNEDTGPFKDLDCSQTLMTYGHHCKVVMDALKKLPPARRSPDQLDQVAFANYPTTLGPIDVAAANHIAANLGIHTPKTKSTKTAGSPRLIEELLSKFNNYWTSSCQYLSSVGNNCFDYAINATAEFAVDTVRECPSYFPPQNSVKLSSSPYTLFNSTSDAALPELLLIAPPPPVMMVGK